VPGRRKALGAFVISITEHRILHSHRARHAQALPVLFRSAWSRHGLLRSTNVEWQTRIGEFRRGWSLDAKPVKPRQAKPSPVKPRLAQPVKPSLVGPRQAVPSLAASSQPCQAGSSRVSSRRALSSQSSQALSCPVWSRRAKPGRASRALPALAMPSPAKSSLVKPVEPCRP
jgi:hypothetical protein